MYDDILDIDRDVSDAEAVEMFHRSVDRNPQYYIALGLYQTNFCHVEYAIDRLIAKMDGQHDYEVWQQKYRRKVTADKLKFIQEDKFQITLGSEAKSRLSVVEQCREKRNELSHAMSGNGEGNLRCATLDQVWGTPCPTAHPNKRAASSIPFAEILRRAAWLRVFQQDLFDLGDKCFVTLRDQGPGVVDFPAYRAPQSWEQVTPAQLDGVLPA